jgi:hypothetical protein
MSSFALPQDAALLPLLDRDAKRTDTEALIRSYAHGHALMDVGIGLAGFIPVPGAGLAAMVATIAAQAPAVYQPMAREIAGIYGRSAGKVEVSEVARGAVSGGVRDVAVDFGVDFFTEIAGELIRELGLGSVLSVIPVLGGFVGMYLDVTIAWTMTWRVGLMLALYHENGGSWIVSRKHTYELVRKRIKADRDQGQPAPTIEQMVAGAPSVAASQETSVSLLARVLLEQGISADDVRRSLIKRGIATELVDSVLKRL